jgi:hypothetical protein
MYNEQCLEWDQDDSANNQYNKITTRKQSSTELLENLADATWQTFYLRQSKFIATTVQLLQTYQETVKMVV